MALAQPRDLQALALALPRQVPWGSVYPEDEEGTSGEKPIGSEVRELGAGSESPPGERSEGYTVSLGPPRTGQVFTACLKDTWAVAQLLLGPDVHICNVVPPL